MTDDRERNAEFVRRTFEEGWNQSTFDFLDGRSAAEIVFHYNGSTQRVTPDSLPGLVEKWRQGFPDLRMNVRHVIADGDLVAVDLTLTGTHLGEWAGHQASGVQVSVEEMMVFRFEEGLLVEMWEVFDEQGLRRQITSPGGHA